MRAWALLIAAALLAWPAFARTVAAEPKAPTAAESNKAMCLVCKVKHGEAEEEPVLATRTHDGVT